MIFGQIRTLITILIITGIAGGGMYVMKLRADNATLKANQIKLETAVAEQNKVLEQQKKDFTAIMESNKKLNVLINTFKKDLQDLDKRFTKKKLAKTRQLGISFLLTSPFLLKSGTIFIPLDILMDILFCQDI